MFVHLFFYPKFNPNFLQPKTQHLTLKTSFPSTQNPTLKTQNFFTTNPKLKTFSAELKQARPAPHHKPF